MTPKWFMAIFQALPLNVGLLALAVIADQIAPLVIAAVVVVVVVGLVLLPIYLLESRGRARPRERTGLDRLVVVLLLATAASGVTALALLLADVEPLNRRDHLAWLIVWGAKNSVRAREIADLQAGR